MIKTREGKEVRGCKLVQLLSLEHDNIVKEERERQRRGMHEKLVYFCESSKNYRDE